MTLYSKALALVAVASLHTMLVACSQGDELLGDATEPTASADLAISFDTYLSTQASGATRAEDSYAGGIVTNKVLQEYGFGIYAATYTNGKYTVTPGNNGTGHRANFMFNQGVFPMRDSEGNVQSGLWQYSPLKYWPNMTKTEGDIGPVDSETGNTAQAAYKQYVSFFAYAPYVKEFKNNSNNKGMYYAVPASDDSVFIPRIGYYVNGEAKNCQDLMWGVAPQGGIHYTAVNGEKIDVDYGKPLVDMLKPDEHTHMKFLFQHALTAMRMTVALAVDQVIPGFKAEDDNTTVRVKEIKLVPDVDKLDADFKELEGEVYKTKVGFAHFGFLCLLNTVANKPRWISQANDDAVKPEDMIIKRHSSGYWNATETACNVQLYAEDGKENIEDSQAYIELSIKDDKYKKPAFGEKEGDPLMFIPVYPDNWVNKDLPVKVTVEYDVVTKDDHYNTYNEDKTLKEQGYVTVGNSVSKDITLKAFRAGRIYNLNIVIGLTSVKVEAEAQDWAVEEQTIDLPRNQ